MWRSGFSILATALLAASPICAEPPLAVEVITVEATAPPHIYSSTGEVVARDLRSVSFAGGGRVTDVLADVGDRVTEGQELARLDPVQQEQQLKAAEAAVAKAAADLAKAGEDARRTGALLAQGAATRAQNDDAQAALTATTALSDKALAERETARKQRADTVLRAPVAGIVTARRIEAGLVVGAAQPAFDIAAGPALDARFDVAEVLLTGRVPADLAVTLTLLEGDGAAVTGRLREVAPVVDATRGTVEIKVAIDGTPAGFSIGAPVRGSVEVPQPPHIRLPVWSLARDAAGAMVWLRDPATGAVTPRPVVIGGFETGAVVIAEGLSPGEQVIGRGAQLMFPGRLTVAAPSEAGQ